MKLVIVRIIIRIKYLYDGAVEVRGYLTGTFLSFLQTRYRDWRIHTIGGGSTRYPYGACDWMGFVVRIRYLYDKVGGGQSTIIINDNLAKFFAYTRYLYVSEGWTVNEVSSLAISNPQGQW